MFLARVTRFNLISMPSSAFTNQKYDLTKHFIWDIPECASCKLSNSFICKGFGIITRFPHKNIPDQHLISAIFIRVKTGLKVFLSTKLNIMHYFANNWVFGLWLINFLMSKELILPKTLHFLISKSHFYSL